MKEFLRYVFFRLKAFRVRVDSDAEEAALTALVFMSLPPGALFVSGDMLVAYFLDAEPLFNLIGRWPYGLGFFGAMFLLHYRALVKGGEAAQIDAEFRGVPRGRRDTCAVVMYLIAPPLLMFVLAGVLARPTWA